MLRSHMPSDSVWRRSMPTPPWCTGASLRPDEPPSTLRGVYGWMAEIASYLWARTAH